MAWPATRLLDLVGRADRARATPHAVTRASLRPESLACVNQCRITPEIGYSFYTSDVTPYGFGIPDDVALGELLFTQTALASELSFHNASARGVRLSEELQRNGDYSRLKFAELAEL